MKVFYVSGVFAKELTDYKTERKRGGYPVAPRRHDLGKFFTGPDAQAHADRLASTSWVELQIDARDEAESAQHPAHDRSIRVPAGADNGPLGRTK